METRNPTIVKILEEKSSIIENRHSGIPTMKREMKNYGLLEPEFYEEKGSFKVIFRNKLVSGQQSGQQSRQQSRQQKIIIKDGKNEVLKFCIEPKTSLEIRNMLKIKSRQYVSTNIIKPLIDAGKLDYTNKNSINSKNQKYITINK